jgi:hypothetical protein
LLLGRLAVGDRYPILGIGTAVTVRVLATAGRPGSHEIALDAGRGAILTF